ncbi:Rieske (2Fe-2S) protein [Arthrobacter sp. B3I4]|uniref:Rieske (2Fe-2S) protein n=1 Tax=Arthrobacter sp. B3I4 TaxID=3042267 RepID=UPI00278A2C51|nr:Rieske (2Fe-2S) protein [Arthrobacter sp. B3I4]MDQ0754595.1 cytochrome b6-f complex iron-sulfur subunit [Arthrobacter sp. B3I4]
MNPEKSLPRRSFLLGAGALGGSAVALSACAGPGQDAAASSAAAGPAVPAGTPVRVGKLSDVQVGGSASGKVNGKAVVVFRPTENTVVAYDAACTHAGCPVAPAGGEFDCPCHGSSFKGSDGSVITGPARAPLGKLQAAVDGEWITVSA